MKLYYKENLIAVQIKREGNPGILKALEPDLLPPDLFKNGATEVAIPTVINWAMSRCMPEERLGVEEELSKLGLSKYDAYEIIKITKAKLQGYDWYTLEVNENDTTDII